MRCGQGDTEKKRKGSCVQVWLLENDFRSVQVTVKQVQHVL